MTNPPYTRLDNSSCVAQSADLPRPIRMPQENAIRKRNGDVIRACENTLSNDSSTISDDAGQVQLTKLTAFRSFGVRTKTPRRNYT